MNICLNHTSHHSSKPPFLISELISTSPIHPRRKPTMPSTTFFLRITVGLACLSNTVGATYYLKDTYDQSNFFSSFNFFTADDPTLGDVQYVSQSVASSSGYIGTSNGAVYMGVDYKTVNPTNGRQSVRLESKKSYTKGLFIADIAHMPASTCGSWPAYWMFGPDWPNSGEIDIIEGVNTQATNAITLHTSPGCTINNINSLPGTTTIGSGNCNQDNAYTGCSVSTSNTNNYGNGFNSVGGGVYAMQWESSGIYVVSN
jgi:hypothetical protein